MRERGDFTVLHEPFSHLANYGSTTIDGKEIHAERELLEVLRTIPGPVFFKDTTDFHYLNLLQDTEFLGAATHTFLIRHPRQAIESHYALHPGLNRDEIGFGWLYEIFAAVTKASGVVPVVVDSDELVERPTATVAGYCEAVGIPFLPEALAWQPGMASGWQRSERWHQATSGSSGFTVMQRQYATSVDDSPMLAEYLRYHLPFYERLREHRLKIREGTG